VGFEELPSLGRNPPRLVSGRGPDRGNARVVVADVAFNGRSRRAFSGEVAQAADGFEATCHNIPCFTVP
jgi:hypothetical protein